MKRILLPMLILVLLLVAAPWALSEEALSPQADPIAAEASETDPLIDQYFEQIEAGQYDEAGKTVDQMKTLEPENPMVPMLRTWVDRFKAEPNEEKRAGLYFEFLGDTFKLLGETFQDIGQSMGDLDEALEELGPQDPDEKLVFAVAEGKAEEVQALLEQGVSANAKDRFGQTALDLAISQGHLQIAQLLINQGADVDTPGLLGMTPLIVAAGRGDLPGVKLLLSAGADPNRKDQMGRSAMSRAKQSEHTQVMDLLKEAGARE